MTISFRAAIADSPRMRALAVLTRALRDGSRECEHAIRIADDKQWALYFCRIRGMPGMHMARRRRRSMPAPAARFSAAAKDRGAPARHACYRAPPARYLPASAAAASVFFDISARDAYFMPP